MGPKIFERRTGHIEAVVLGLPYLRKIDSEGLHVAIPEHEIVRVDEGDHAQVHCPGRVAVEPLGKGRTRLLGEHRFALLVAESQAGNIDHQRIVMVGLEDRRCECRRHRRYLRRRKNPFCPQVPYGVLKDLMFVTSSYVQRPEKSKQPPYAGTDRPNRSWLKEIGEPDKGRQIHPPSMQPVVAKPRREKSSSQTKKNDRKLNVASHVVTPLPSSLRSGGDRRSRRPGAKTD